MPAEQLSLPNVVPEQGRDAAALAQIPHARRIWVNRTLRMDQIEWVGFDMDYTLAIYRQEAIDRLSVEATVRKLVERGYAPQLAEAPYPLDLPVRGLLVDKRFGHLLKMDRYRYVGRAFHGTRELSFDERRALYHARRVRPVAPRYHWIDTLYALPEAAVYAGAVDVLDRYGFTVDYAQLFQDVRECIDEAHRDGTIVRAILAGLDAFLVRDPDLAATLHRLRSAGKKLFLLTNSQAGYTERVMAYLLDGRMAEYPSWKQYFDVVTVDARKPSFFVDKRPFLEITPEGGSQPATRLERGKVYANGNLRDLERLLRVDSDRVLYVGDHIYGDILRSKKETAWRTLMILQEMEGESAAFLRTSADVLALDELERRRARLEDELRFHQARFKALSRAVELAGLPAALVEASPGEARADGLSGPAPFIPPDATVPALEAEKLRAKRAIDPIRAGLRALEEQVRTLSRAVDGQFHPYWGSLFKQGVELSSFGDQVEAYACLYTSRVSNLLSYSPLHQFRSSRALMPHEV